VNIYCDESGGVGRGVMTLAAIGIGSEDAARIIEEFRTASGHRGEVKGSRIDLDERAALFEMLGNVSFHASVSIAISAVQPDPGADRGDHDIAIYRALLNDAVTTLLPLTGGCAEILVDDGRYGPGILSVVRADVAQDLGPFGSVRFDVSHASAGLQLADVIANTFFNRALVSDRQARMAGIVAPFLKDRRIIMQILSDDTQGDD
jgi:hypothetical protein